MGLEVTAGGGAGSGRQEGGWAGMRKRGSREGNQEEREGRKRGGKKEGRSRAREPPGRAALASSPGVQVPHLRPRPAGGRRPRPSPKGSRAARAARMLQPAMFPGQASRPGPRSSEARSPGLPWLRRGDRWKEMGAAGLLQAFADEGLRSVGGCFALPPVG